MDKKGNGTFAAAMRGLKTLKKARPWVGVKMTVMPANVPNLYDDVRGLYDMGVNQFIIGHATGLTWCTRDMEAYAAQLGRVFEWYKAHPRDDLRITDFEDVEQNERGFFGCQAGRVSITVAVNGEISPCSKILALNNKQLLSKLGDVRRGMTHIINRSKLVGCDELRQQCERQGLAEQFEGGCFASNFEEHGDLFQPSLQEHKFSLLKRSACAGCASCTK